MSSKTNTFEVIVFGNRAVGKTSLLSSMYMQMEAQGVTDCNGMKFSTLENGEFNILRDKWTELQNAITENEFTSSLVIPYNGTIALFTEHPFEFKTEKYQQIIKFIDTRGDATGQTDANLINRINESLLMLCVVDASILMELNEAKNEELNCPVTIKKILSDVLGDGDDKQPVSCMFILTKCEKYMHTLEERNRMAARFEKIFSPVFIYAAEKHFPLYYLPVQTMGCVEFSRIDPITEEMKFKTVNKAFKPVDVIFPLAYLLKTLLIHLNKRQEEAPWWWKVMYYWLFNMKEKNFSAYYENLRKKLGNPIDFRGNRQGTSQHLDTMDFWE